MTVDDSFALASEQPAASMRGRVHASPNSVPAEQWLASLPFPAAIVGDDDGLITANPDFHGLLRTDVGAFADDLHRSFEGLPSGADSMAALDGCAAYHAASGHWFLLRLRDLRDACRLLVATDLSERVAALHDHRELQEQLLFSSRAMSLGEMTTTLAHELNQPLATILNYLSAARTLLDRNSADQSEEARALLSAGLAQAQLQTEHAAAVVARIREFVRTREPVREARDLGESIGRVLQLQRLAAAAQQVRLAADIDPSLPAVMMDRVMVEQVVSNLVRNAIEAMDKTPPSEREVRVAVQRSLDGRAEVRVSDRGPGLGAHAGEDFFAPFFTTKSSGMGVGLSICRSIIEYHEGSLYAEANEGPGLSFVFTLPLADLRGAAA